MPDRPQPLAQEPCPGDEQTLSVRLSPGVAALTGLVSVLHARAAEVEHLVYASEDGEASVQIRTRIGPERARRLATHLGRRVDVLTVSVRSPAGTRTPP